MIGFLVLLRFTSSAQVAAEEASGAGGDGNLSRCTITMTLIPKYFPEELYARQKRCV